MTQFFYAELIEANIQPTLTEPKWVPAQWWRDGEKEGTYIVNVEGHLYEVSHQNVRAIETIREIDRNGE